MCQATAECCHSLTPLPELQGRGTEAPEYWVKAKRALTREDPVLAAIIRNHPGISLVCRGEPFYTLARSIVGQQISVQAAATVWRRFEVAVGRVSPGNVLRASNAALLTCGLSRRKSEYIIDLASHFDTGALDPDAWPTLDDDEVIAELTTVRGIGRWTAEMFLIFNLLRPDVLPLADIGLQRAVALQYFSGRQISARTLTRLGNRWAPWRSVATWYLWRSLDPEPVAY